MQKFPPTARNCPNSDVDKNVLFVTVANPVPCPPVRLYIGVGGRLFIVSKQSAAKLF